MDLTEIIKEIFENFPEKMVVDISEYENEEHQSYKYLFENLKEEKSRLDAENFNLHQDIQSLEKDYVNLQSEVKDLRRKVSALSESVVPTMDALKGFCAEMVIVSDIKADPEHSSDPIYDVEEFSANISDHPGIYGTNRPSWFTPLQHELSKKNVQRKNVKHTADALFHSIMFWKKAGKRIAEQPEAVADEYDSVRKANILDLINSDCSNEEKYLKYFLMTPGLDREYLKTLEGASELNINAKLLISLLEQPNNQYNRDIIEVYVSNLHKGTEYNLKQELAEELIKGEWYITANINGYPEKFQMVPVSVLDNLIHKIDSVCEFLESGADDGLPAKLAESPSNDGKDEIQDISVSGTEIDMNQEIPSFVEFDDSML